MYCAPARRHVFSNSPGTAVYAWTTAATRSAGAATGTQFSSRPGTVPPVGHRSVRRLRVRGMAVSRRRCSGQKWATAATDDTIPHNSTYDSAPSSSAVAIDVGGHRAGMPSDPIGRVVGDVGRRPAPRGDGRSSHGPPTAAAARRRRSPGAPCSPTRPRCGPVHQLPAAQCAPRQVHALRPGHRRSIISSRRRIP